MGYTIKDIALRAGVSKSTVSRVITGTGKTSLEAREKVWSVIEELNYKPNAVARAMVSQRTGNIGVIIYRSHHPIVSHPFYGKLLDSILEMAEKLNYSVFVTTDKDMSQKSADFMFEKRVDGLILISRLSKEVVGYIDSFRVPYVILNGTTDKDDIVQIVNDEINGGELAASHLYEFGHDQIGVIAGSQDHRSHHLRLKGFLHQLEKYDYQIKSEHLYLSQTSQFEDGYKGMLQIWENSGKHKPTAIFATNDLLALGAIRFLWEQGVRIPQDISIIGFDNIELGEKATPPLTTIHIEKTEMAQDAVISLDHLIKKEPIGEKSLKYKPKLIVRSTTRNLNL